MNHTKGKWMVAITDKIGQRKDRLEIVADTPYEGITGGEKETPICNLLQIGSYKEYEANAKLIAAAPELLEALKDLRLIARNGIDDNFQSLNVLFDIEKASNKAIKKAES